ncbi:UPF0158 family protein [Geomonas sp. Red69]|uniref:UPF0158 family protein n=1 Tax=Geomonas diazotrophica TaxID=2843197 RepID=A0ABX8JL31_9BACT|nr:MULTISPECIES: UPF0158 family protein [Geomonas]MBU5635732.1 UPF0158 family protein [Geomonas diazotrophica]QWV98032.1 UPF0158 family protein [Geomonas nitrogeniifigens]QXE87163.1 UPF0158 family protein [Geomonas nitrogeniifigens]
MHALRNLEIVWEDLMEAFENGDPDMIYFLDRETGEVFSVPAEYEDESFWEEVASQEERFLEVPPFDYGQERQLVHAFIQRLTNESLKGMLARAFSGKQSHGRLHEILSFYPEEQERFQAIREAFLTDRAAQWLEEHDIYPPERF